MRFVIFTAGILAAALGIAAFAWTRDPSMLQGGLTLGGGWIICGLFSLNSKWHGIAGAGVLALLGGARCAPAFLKLATAGTDPQIPFQAIAGVLSLTVLFTTLRAFFAERSRRQIEQLKAAGDSDS